MGNDLRVRDVMSSDVFTLGRNDELSIADNLMKQSAFDTFRSWMNMETFAASSRNGDLFRGALLRGAWIWVARRGEDIAGDCRKGSHE